MWCVYVVKLLIFFIIFRSIENYVYLQTFTVMLSIAKNVSF